MRIIAVWLLALIKIQGQSKCEIIEMDFQILFENNIMISPQVVAGEIDSFGTSYTQNVREIITSTEADVINEELFIRNTAKILTNFKMTRQGPFKGVRFSSDKVVDPNNILDMCWDAIGGQIKEIKLHLNSWHLKPRSRTLILMDTQQLDEVTDIIWRGFKNLLPITMSHHSYGLVAASKILFAIFPEIVLPVDNAEWKLLFKTVDLSDVIKNMTQEIKEWEKMTGQQLTDCEKEGRPTTLVAIYNVMAMRARPTKTEKLLE